MFFEDSWGRQGSLGREVARTAYMLPGPLLVYYHNSWWLIFTTPPRSGWRGGGHEVTWRASHLFGGTEQVGKNRKQNYNPFGLKSNLRSVNVCFDGQETNFQVTGPELTACIQKCLQRTSSRTKVLSGKGKEKNAIWPYFPKTSSSASKRKPKCSCLAYKENNTIHSARSTNSGITYFFIIRCMNVSQRVIVQPPSKLWKNNIRKEQGVGF